MNDKIRAEFEKWYNEATNNNGGVAYYVEITGEYCFPDIEREWQSWQAAHAKYGQCPHIISDSDGTSYCGLAASTPAQPAQQQVPEGYVLAPVEPTNKMKNAGTSIGVYLDHECELDAMTWEEVTEIYKAMLTASQENQK